MPDVRFINDSEKVTADARLQMVRTPGPNGVPRWRQPTQNLTYEQVKALGKLRKTRTEKYRGGYRHEYRIVLH